MSPSAQRLQAYLHGRAVLMGIGNRWRGDDAAGPAVIARVGARTHARCIDAGDAPERHLGEAVEGNPETILLVDAVDFGGAPGEAALFTMDDLPKRPGTTHDTSLSLLIGYLRATSGAEVILLGIQPGTTDFGDPMCPAVDDAVRAIADMLVARLGEAPELAACGAQPGRDMRPHGRIDSAQRPAGKGAEEGGQSQ